MFSYINKYKKNNFGTFINMIEGQRERISRTSENDKKQYQPKTRAYQKSKE